MLTQWLDLQSLGIYVAKLVGSWLAIDLDTYRLCSSLLKCTSQKFKVQGPRQPHRSSYVVQY